MEQMPLKNKKIRGSITVAGLVKRDGRFLYSHIQAVTEDREKIEEQIAVKIN